MLANDDADAPNQDGDIRDELASKLSAGCLEFTCCCAALVLCDLAGAATFDDAANELGESHDHLDESPLLAFLVGPEICAVVDVGDWNDDG